VLVLEVVVGLRRLLLRLYYANASRPVQLCDNPEMFDLIDLLHFTALKGTIAAELGCNG
jgi:hypothetical protein